MMPGARRLGFACSLLAAALLIALVTPWLTTRVAKLSARSDVYALPPRYLLRPVSLGHTAALADIIWAHVLVTQGLRTSENRPFEHLENYLDAIHELDPGFREPYRLAHSLLIFQRNDPNPEHSVRTARRIMEAGLQRFPHDASLWLDYGEFLAYLAPPYLPDSKEQARWKRDGARAIIRAGELGSKDDNLYWRSISAVALLSKEGERDAMLRFLERVYTMTEDEELKRNLEGQIGVLRAGRGESRRLSLNKAFEELWRTTTPFVSRTQRRVLGPTVDPWKCSGALPPVRPESCLRNWTAWARSVAGPDPDYP